MNILTIEEQLKYTEELNNYIESDTSVDSFIDLYKKYYQTEPSVEIITQYKTQCSNYTTYEEDNSSYSY